MNTKDNFDIKEFEIIKKTKLLDDTFLFAIDGRIDFIPGQFIQISLEHFGEITVAICSDPKNKKTFEICVRGCGNTSNAIINLIPGDKIKVRGPYGNGWPIKKLRGKEITLIAGGLGYVPLRPLLIDLIRNKSKYKKIYLFAGFRSADHILFAEELKAYIKSLDALRVVAEYADKNFWGQKGLITEPLGKKIFNPQNTIVLMCGPEIMCPFCNKVLLNKGIAEKNIYISMERRMECGIGVCQHCSCGKHLVCKDGPVFSLDQIKEELTK